MSKTFSIKLETGTLHLDLEPGSIPIRRLLGFAARISSKRKFLLVSKVLGKHYPVSPKMMAWSYRALARSLLKKDPCRNSVWIGMAETATGLGYGVFEAACCEGLNEALFMQTTRYHLSGRNRLEFDEAHSHATQLFLYYPEETNDLERFLTAETLVLIDDEISTGKTFLRLIKAYLAINPFFRKVLIVSLVNFAGKNHRNLLETEAGVSVEWISIRQGLLRFDDACNDAVDSLAVNVTGNSECKSHLLAWPGRLGIRLPVTLAENDLALLMRHLGTNGDTGPLLVLGTGECNAPAFLLARELERRGYSVKVQSTTRSPIHVGNDITTACRFEDNYQDGIPNFVYNLDPGQYREIILCHETPLCQALLERLQQWNAISARIELAPRSSHAKLNFFRPERDAASNGEKMRARVQ
ncbi:MAG: phosphoribosyltransferase domain-containing protein [Gammaproteobacteria bacterium]